MRVRRDRDEVLKVGQLTRHWDTHSLQVGEIQDGIRV